MRDLLLTRLLISIFIAICLLLILLVVINERWSDGDEVHYLLVSSSLIKDGDLQLENNYENKDYFAHHSHEESPHEGLGRYDEFRPAHGILTSIIVTPGYGLSLVGKEAFGFESTRFFLFFPRLTILIIHIIFSLIMINLLRTLGFSKNLSILGVIMFLIQLPIIIYSQVIYSDLLAAYFIMMGIFGVLLFTKNNRYKWLITGSTFLGLCIFLHSKLIIFTAILILSSFIYLHLNLTKSESFSIKDWFKSGYYRKIVYSILGPWLAFLTANVIIKFYWFGTFFFDAICDQPSKGGYLTLIENPLRGWLGQWLDIEVGLIPNAPVFALSFVGLFVWFRKQKSSFLLIVPPTLAYLLLNSSVEFWDGGFCPPGRYLLISLPLLLPGLCWVLWKSKKLIWLRCIIGILTFFSLLLSSLIPFVGRRGLPYFDGYNIYWRTILKFLRLDFLEPIISLNFFKPEILDYILGSGIFILLLGLGFYLQRRNSDTVKTARTDDKK